MADRPTPLPTQRVKNQFDVRDLALDREGLARCRGRQPALLVRSDPKTVAEVRRDAVEVLVGKARSSVEQEHRWTLTGNPAS